MISGASAGRFSGRLGHEGLIAAVRLAFPPAVYKNQTVWDLNNSCGERIKWLLL